LVRVCSMERTQRRFNICLRNNESRSNFRYTLLAAK
jgi:hypothetical protein